jgi:hypothetical protein
METQNTAFLEHEPAAPISSECAYEDAWYRVLKRLSEEGAPDDGDVGGEDAKGR